MRVLREGMRAGDLEDLVLPLISVDEFESKVDDDAVVFGFYVSDYDAAEDLNRFIQKSPIPLLDTEVSPAPDEHGYYFVFFEIMNDDDLADNVANVLEEVSDLTKIGHWKMRVRGVKDLMPFNKKVLRKLPGDQREEGLHEAIYAFLTPSGLTNAILEGDYIRLEGMGHIGTYKVVAFGSYDEIDARINLTESAKDCSMIEVAKEMRLTRMLGEGWSVSRLAGLSVLQHFETENLLVLEDF